MKSTMTRGGALLQLASPQMKCQLNSALNWIPHSRIIAEVLEIFQNASTIYCDVCLLRDICARRNVAVGCREPEPL